MHVDAVEQRHGDREDDDECGEGDESAGHAGSSPTAPGFQANATSRPWSVGAEDLSFAPTSGRLYSLTEKPGQRVVFAVPAP